MVPTFILGLIPDIFLQSFFKVRTQKIIHSKIWIANDYKIKVNTKVNFAGYEYCCLLRKSV